MIYSIMIQKGGTGKTTTAAILSQAATHRGKRALAVDLDPQGNLTFSLAADPSRPGVYEVLHGMNAAQATQESPQGIDVLSAGPQLQTERTAQGSARRLRFALQPIRSQYDYIFIDTPATAGELQYNALQAADGLIIPIKADSFSLQSLYQTAATAEQIRATNPGLFIAGVIFTEYDGRAKINRQMRQVIAQKGTEIKAPILGAVRKGCAVTEAAALQVSIFDYAPRSNPAKDYMLILNQLV